MIAPDQQTMSRETMSRARRFSWLRRDAGRFEAGRRETFTPAARWRTQQTNFDGAMLRSIVSSDEEPDHPGPDETRFSSPCRFTVSCDAGGSWHLSGGDDRQVRRFADLPAALDRARRSCNAAPAEIAIWVDGLYIYVRQRRGWPDRLCKTAA